MSQFSLLCFRIISKLTIELLRNVFLAIVFDLKKASTIILCMELQNSMF